VWKYVLQGHGMFNTTGLDGQIMLKTKLAEKANSPVPDLQMYIWNTGGNFDPKITELKLMNFAKTQMEMRCGSYEDYDFDEVTKQYRGGVNQIMILLCGLHPESVGHISLKSKNPMDHPLIAPNYYEKDEDVELMKEGLKIGDAIVSNPKFFDKYVQKKLYCDGTLSGVHNSLDKLQLEKFIRGFSITSYHPVGTCKMGDVNKDPMAVVDGKLKLKNINNLRVADGSIIPTLTSGNTQAPIAMIGERAAAFALEKWNENSN